VQRAVSLLWNASTSPGVVSYSAYRSALQGGPYMLVSSALTGLSYNDASVQCGERLGIGEMTVKNRLRDVFDRAGVWSRRS
jgi:hypothetical protein